MTNKHQIHRVIVQPAFRKNGRYDCTKAGQKYVSLFKNEYLCTSTEPFLESARLLKAKGHKGDLEMWHQGSDYPSMIAPLGRNKVKGRMVIYPKTPTTERLKSEIKEINEFLKGFTLTGATHRGYRRIYNQGDDLKTYKWDKGGRLYGSGDDNNYLIIKKAKRKKMLIDGEATVEIDVRASYAHSPRGSC